MRSARLIAIPLVLGVLCLLGPPGAVAAGGEPAMPGMPGMAGMGSPGQESGNIELFLSLRGQASSRQSEPPDLDERTWAVGDLVFAGERGRFRLMGEYNLSTAEHDFERLQVGIEPVPDTLVWLGRFHQPGSAWNNEYHHGPYLQTSISRPSIEQWEDEDGVVPQHLAGVLAESRWPIARGHGLQVALGLGYGSALGSEGFDPIGVLESSGRGHHVSTTAQFAFQPTYLGQSSAGLLFGQHLSGVVDQVLRSTLQADQVAQRSIGAYAHYAGERLHWLAVIYRIAVQYEAPAAPAVREQFSAGYLQVEVPLPHRLTLYFRHENSPAAQDSRLAAAVADNLVIHGNFAGLRLDLPHRQALTLEASRASTVEGLVNRVRLQWSAALP
jgi:hypothetical protein